MPVPLIAPLIALTKTFSPRTWFFIFAVAGQLYAGWWTRGVWEDSKRADELERRAAMKADAEANMAEKSKQTEAELARLRTVNRQITAIMERELAKDDYRCPVPSGAVRLLNDAIGGRSPGGQPDAGM